MKLGKLKRKGNCPEDVFTLSNWRDTTQRNAKLLSMLEQSTVVSKFKASSMDGKRLKKKKKVKIGFSQAKPFAFQC